MQFINTLSTTPDVNNWLANSRHPCILHIFDHACNLINERREVLSIVTPQIGNGPFNLVIEDDVLFSDHLNLESPVSVFPNQLNFGDLTIHTTDAKLWSPHPDWETLHARRDDILSQLMSLRLSNPLANLEIASRRLAMTLPQLPITNYQSQVSNIQSSNSLISALANADPSSSIAAAQKLAGLGMGLTPAGDDFILGAVLASWIIHPPEIARVLAKEVTDVAAPLTTSLSASWLKSAGKGEAAILWHNFFDDLISANETAIQVSIDKILSVGETSGADALAGFISLFVFWSVEARTLDG